MILDLNRFVEREQYLWKELEALLRRFENDPALRLDITEARRLHHLYLKTGADLAKVRSQGASPQLKDYLESLVSRAYAEIHADRARGRAFSPRAFYLHRLPATFRRHAGAFFLSLLITLAGALAGGLLIRWDPESKDVLLPFDHLHGSPRDRVAAEESRGARADEAPKTLFASQLMTHNIRVAILTLVLGLAWGAGPLVLLFYNGVILGAVSYDYVADGQTLFLLGWLLPHGAIEIPAILIAGQAGLVLGDGVFRRRAGGRKTTLSRSLRDAAPDLAVLMGGIASLLVWAGLVEAFFSQYHAPVLPYGAKIAFGTLELAALALYLAFAGRKRGADHGR